MKSRHGLGQLTFALGQILAFAAMASAWFLVGGFKGDVAAGGKLIFFALIGVSCLFGFGSLLLLSGQARSSVSWVPVVGLLVVGSGSAVLAPVFAGARAAATKSVCILNSKKLGTAMFIYMVDWDERFPPTEKWQELIQPFTAVENRNLRCPISDLPFSYAMNRALSRVHLGKLEDPAKTILLFEAWSNNPNKSGGKGSFVATHGQFGSAYFADGIAKMVIPTDSSIRWKP
ncbi:MAG: hypothetical protein H7Y17_14495 [Chlorobia bacterium]|nr:hypothetical protein [Fimbriimonadaceae bacterium]